MAHPLLRTLLGFVIAVGGSSAGCYTDPVNMRPTVRIDTPVGLLFAGQPVKYTATASDPDGERPTLRWLRLDDVCMPQSAERADLWPQPTEHWQVADELDLTEAETKAPFCVWAKATDRYGAASVDALTGAPENHAPVATLELVEPADAPAFPLGTMFVVSARSSFDADTVAGDELTFDMSFDDNPSVAAFNDDPSKIAKLEPCVAPGTAIATPPDASVQCFTASGPGDYRVRVTVTDRAGAADTRELSLHVTAPQPPLAVLELVQPSAPAAYYGLDQVFRVSSVDSKGDGAARPAPTWSLTKPPSSNASLQPCGDAPYEQCFTPDVPGPYQVFLTVHASGGDSAVVEADYVVVADQPPCVDKTTPDFTVPTMETEFNVDQVSDDLDPSPSMQWFVSKNGGDFMLALSSRSSFSLNKAAFSFGDVARVRLEIRDRDIDRSNKELLACGNADTCTAPSLVHPDACFQRVTWTVSFLLSGSRGP